VAGIAIFGITGRMGQTVVRALREQDPGGAAPLVLTGAIGSARSSRLGQDAALVGPATGVAVTAEPRLGLLGASVAMDFSLPQCVAANARACADARVPLLVGTTGWDGEAEAALTQAAAGIAVLIAPNTSVGVNLVAHLVRLAARAMPQADVEISEAHHRMKRDAPSGTALALGRAIAGTRGRRLEELAVFDRHGSAGPRGDGEIGFSVLRAGDIVGDHTVTFAVAGERVEITHRATDRITFARGALTAADWLRGRPPGLYTMDDVLGLDKP
jgi:4-hydroxy-tetrahydrodipicolinate reductase